MKDMNKLFLMGRLGADPTPKETKSGVKMVTFPVATSKWSKDAGEAITQWHRVVAWGKQSEQCASYLKKGQSVLIEGSVRIRKYPGKDGVERTSVEVHADDVVFLGGGFKGKMQAEDGTVLPEGLPAERIENPADEQMTGAAEYEDLTHSEDAD